MCLRRLITSAFRSCEPFCLVMTCQCHPYIHIRLLSKKFLKPKDTVMCVCTWMGRCVVYFNDVITMQF